MAAPHKMIDEYDCGCDACYRHRTDNIVYGKLHRTVNSPHNPWVGNYNRPGRRTVIYWRLSSGPKKLLCVEPDDLMFVVPVCVGEFVRGRDRSNETPSWLWDQRLAWAYTSLSIVCLSPFGIVGMLPGDLVLVDD